MTKEQLTELESLGELQFTLAECALILQIEPEELNTEDKNIINAYERGRLKASAAVRKAILQQAKQGSTPAQKQMLELIEKASKSQRMSTGEHTTTDIMKGLPDINEYLKQK